MPTLSRKFWKVKRCHDSSDINNLPVLSTKFFEENVDDSFRGVQAKITHGVTSIWAFSCIYLHILKGSSKVCKLFYAFLKDRKRSEIALSAMSKSPCNTRCLIKYIIYIHHRRSRFQQIVFVGNAAFTKLRNEANQ